MTGIHRVLPGKFFAYLDHEVEKLVERCLTGQVPEFMQDEKRDGEIIIHILYTTEQAGERSVEAGPQREKGRRRA